VFAVPANVDRFQTERRMPMKKFVQSVLTALIMIVLVVGLSGCTKEGPVEKAGKKIDKTLEKAGDQIEKAGEKVKDAVK
jgi:predicted small lipoprotein YifL